MPLFERIRQDSESGANVATVCQLTQFFIDPLLLDESLQSSFADWEAEYLEFPASARALAAAGLFARPRNSLPRICMTACQNPKRGRVGRTEGSGV